jgi:hypothetical protein
MEEEGCLQATWSPAPDRKWRNEHHVVSRTWPEMTQWKTPRGLPHLTGNDAMNTTWSPAHDRKWRNQHHVVFTQLTGNKGVYVVLSSNTRCLYLFHHLNALKASGSRTQKTQNSSKFFQWQGFLCLVLKIAYLGLTDYWLLTTNCWLLTADCWILTAEWLLTADCWLLTADCWLLTADYWLVTSDYWLLTIDYWLLRTDYWLLVTDYWVLTTDY